MLDLSDLPGGDLVEKGLRDLEQQLTSPESLLIMVASPRLRDLGFSFPDLPDVALPYEHRLYEMLEESQEAGAHYAYNALIQRIVSFANAYYLVYRKPTSQSTES